jgi:hypothetical protein
MQLMGPLKRKTVQQVDVAEQEAEALQVCPATSLKLTLQPYPPCPYNRCSVQPVLVQFCLLLYRCRVQLAAAETSWSSAGSGRRCVLLEERRSWRNAPTMVDEGGHAVQLSGEVVFPEPQTKVSSRVETTPDRKTPVKKRKAIDRKTEKGKPSMVSSLLENGRCRRGIQW